MAINTPQLALPTAGVWDVDVSHSNLGFVARHLMVTKVRGSFEKFDASITVGDSFADLRGEAVIDVSSITTNDERRDGHLRSADFFDVDNNPEMRFVSTNVAPVDETHFKVTGDFTIRGITKPLTLDVEYLGLITNPWNQQVAALSASAEIDREAWGLTWNQALESGGVLVSRKIQLEIEVQAKLREA